MKEVSYHQKKNIEYIRKLRELLLVLPPWLSAFFRGIETSHEPRTLIAYAIDLKIFFEYICEANPDFHDRPMREIPFEILNLLTNTDIEDYVQYLKLYTNEEGKDIVNTERGLKRKLSSLRAMYAYYHKNMMISENPTLQVEMPKLHEKTITKLEADEVAGFLNVVDSGEKLTDNQLRFHKVNRCRDLALLTLMLGTGIRVSECVGLDINDVDIDNSRIKITRKGGSESFVYFGEEVSEALFDYIEVRKEITAVKGHENALFLSSRKQRISVRNVETMVKKYAGISTPLKKITPHKLRSTYGTALYRETGDIYLVADVLGHKDVNTTKKHYAAIEDDRRRSAKDAVKLRKD